MNGDTDPEPTVRKIAHRISVACQNCRSRRTRCDGQQPTCGTCLRIGKKCEFLIHEDRRKPPSRRYVESLQAQIYSQQNVIDQLRAKLENVAPKLPPYDHAVSWSGRNDQGSHLLQPQAQRESSTERRASISSDDESDPGTFAEDQSESPSATQTTLVDDLTQLMGRFNLGEDGELRYFGSPSNFTLLHGPMCNITARSLQQVRVEASNALEKLHLNNDPTLELQLHLLDLFWVWQNPWQYIVHKKAFMDEFNAGVRGLYCTSLLLCAILALASRYSDRPETRSQPTDPNTAGDMFVRKAKVLLFHELEAPTTSTVQAGILVALYEYAVNRETSAWVHMGMAVRMAHTLGLNVDCSGWVSRGQIYPLEEEVRRIAWWACFFVDKLCNVGLGRPSAIQSQDMTTPKPHLAADIELSQWPPSREEKRGIILPEARIGSTCHAACELFCIVSTPLEKIYAPNSGLSKKEKLSLALSADVALSTFHNKLPSFLRLPNSSRRPALPHVYSFTCNIRCA